MPTEAERRLHPHQVGRRTKNPIFLFLTAALTLDTTAAQAKCDPVTFDIRLGEQTSIARVTDGSPCGFKLQYARDPIYGTDIVTQPRHGSVIVKGRTFVRYTPTSGYKGTDKFSFQFVGKKNEKPAAATMNVTILVK